MSDLYWLITLGTLGTLCAVFAFLSGIAFVISIICNVSSSGENTREEETMHKVSSSWSKFTGIALFISLIGVIFIPNRQDLYTIYGIGTVIDYAKGSKEVQKLPDNAVKCLNIWLEEHQDTISNGK